MIRTLLRRIFRWLGLGGEAVRVRGEVEIICRDAKTGRVLSRKVQSNDVKDGGLTWFRDLCGGNGFRAGEIAVGTDNSGSPVTATALQAETFRGAVNRRFAASSTAIKFQLLLGTGDNNSNAMAEVGLFELGTGTMIGRATIGTPDTKTSGITATINYTLTIARG